MCQTQATAPGDIFLPLPSWDFMHTLSKLYRNRSTEGPSCLKDSVGSSGRTCANLLAHVKRHHPKVVLLENVEELKSNGGENMHYLYSELDAKRIQRNRAHPQRHSVREPTEACAVLHHCIAP